MAAHRQRSRSRPPGNDDHRPGRSAPESSGAAANREAFERPVAVEPGSDTGRDVPQGRPPAGECVEERVHLDVPRQRLTFGLECRSLLLEVDDEVPPDIRRSGRIRGPLGRISTGDETAADVRGGLDVAQQSSDERERPEVSLDDHAPMTAELRLGAPEFLDEVPVLVLHLAKVARVGGREHAVGRCVDRRGGVGEGVGVAIGRAGLVIGLGGVNVVLGYLDAELVVAVVVLELVLLGLYHRYRSRFLVPVMRSRT